MLYKNFRDSFSQTVIIIREIYTSEEVLAGGGSKEDNQCVRRTGVNSKSDMYGFVWMGVCACFMQSH